MESLFETPFGAFRLNRSPDETNQTLQAWSSADSYILNEMAAAPLPEGADILVMNDSFGALSLPLSKRYKVNSWSDSYCSRKYTEDNIKENGIAAGSVSFLGPEEPFPSDPAFIVIRNPKSLNFLEYQLQFISGKLGPGIPVIAGDMAREIHSSTVSLFEYYLDGVETSLAWKKARLIRGETGGKQEPLNRFPSGYKPEGEPFSLINYPNLFAFGRLDPGSAFMLSRFPCPEKTPGTIVDLACGDGILALKAASLWPEASITCTDESWLAVRSARESFDLSGFTNPVEFKVADVLEGVISDPVDLILCNPPFHDSRSLSTATALRMFRQSRDSLRRGGELYVIANRHLGYEKVLDRFFSSAGVIASNRKFSLIRAVR